MESEYAGYFSKTHGLKGRLFLREDRTLIIDGLKVLFVELGGDRIPMFISALDEAGGTLVVELEEINSVEKARTLVGKKVFVDPLFIDEEAERESPYLGYELIDEKLGSLGKIEGVTEAGGQEVLSLTYKEKEVLLPLSGDLVKKVDDSRKTIYYSAPDGLIDIYLSE
jgi:16S rRNA processing protein RimM